MGAPCPACNRSTQDEASAKGGAGIRPGHAGVFQRKDPARAGRDRIAPVARANPLSAAAGQKAKARGRKADVSPDEDHA
jgi:hypothetical protein